MFTANDDCNELTLKVAFLKSDSLIYQWQVRVFFSVLRRRKIHSPHFDVHWIYSRNLKEEYGNYSESTLCRFVLSRNYPFSWNLFLRTAESGPFTYQVVLKLKTFKRNIDIGIAYNLTAYVLNCVITSFDSGYFHTCNLTVW